jgi:hypothetical protein
MVVDTLVNVKREFCFALFQREGMFRFDSAERANREPAAGVSLQVFDVGSGSVAGFPRYTEDIEQPPKPSHPLGFSI